MSSDCNEFNQYYTDVVIDGKIVNDRCFKGLTVYKEKFNVKSYNNYDSKGYYDWINKNFKEYAFPDEKYN